MAYTLYSEAPGWRSGGRRERTFELPPSPRIRGVAGEGVPAPVPARGAGSGSRPLSPSGAGLVLEVVEARLRSSATGRAVTLKG